MRDLSSVAGGGDALKARYATDDTPQMACEGTKIPNLIGRGDIFFYCQHIAMIFAAAARSISLYSVSVKPMPIRTKMSGTSIDTGRAMSAKIVAVQLGRMNIEMHATSSNELNCITARELVLSE